VANSRGGSFLDRLRGILDKRKRRDRRKSGTDSCGRADPVPATEGKEKGKGESGIASNSITYLGKNYLFDWGDEFNDPALPMWLKDDLLSDDLHLAGNKDLDSHGNEGSGNICYGARWGARYDRHQEKTAFVEGGQLIMRPVVERIKNELRESFKQDGNYYPFGENVISLPWLTTGSRIFSTAHDRQITNFSKPLHVWRPGSLVTYKIDFSRMNSRNVRHSIWGMPLCEVDAVNTPENPADIENMSDSYDDDIIDAEDDLHEYLWSTRRNWGLLSMKHVAGDAGDTNKDLHERSRDGTIDLGQLIDGTPLGVLLGSGPVVMTHIWHKDGSRTWLINDHEVQHDPRKVRTQSYFILSMEACDGIKQQGIDNIKPNDITIGTERNLSDDHPEANEYTGPKRQWGSGLDGQPWVLDADIAEQCETRMDYFRVYREAA